MQFCPAFKMLGFGLSLNGAERGERVESASVLNKTCAEKYSANSCISMCPLLHLPPPPGNGRYIQKKHILPKTLTFIETEWCRTATRKRVTRWPANLVLLPKYFGMLIHLPAHGRVSVESASGTARKAVRELLASKLLLVTSSIKNKKLYDGEFGL